MSFWLGLLTNGSGHAAAHNAHLAELTLPHIPLQSRLQIVEAMAHIMRNGAQRYASLRDYEITEVFDAFPRVVQLNFLALAMNTLGYPTGVPGEKWLGLRTPIDSLMDEKDVMVSAGYFKRKHHIDVFIGRDSMNLSAWLDDERLWRSGEPRNLDEASIKPLPAEDEKDANAQRELGVKYHQGLGVAKDYPKALKWYRLSAAQGNAMAQHNLGVMYRNGQGVTQNHQEALKWFRLSADKGFAYAELKIAEMYAEGLGVAQDLVRAYCWFNRAASNRSSEAPEIKLAQEKRSEVIKKMTPTQLDEARKIALD